MIFLFSHVGLFTVTAVLFGLDTIGGTSVLPGDKPILVGCPFHEGALGQALQVIEPFVDHIPHAIGEMIPVASVDQHALPALAVVGTLLGAASIIDAALPDFVQSFHFQLVLLLRRHRFILLTDHFLVVVDFYLFSFSMYTSFPH